MKNTITIVQTLNVAQVPMSNLLPEVKKLLDGKETFVDTDKNLSESLYTVDIFSELLNNKTDTMSEESETQLNELLEKLGNFNYVMFTAF